LNSWKIKGYPDFVFVQIWEKAKRKTTKRKANDEFQARRDANPSKRPRRGPPVNYSEGDQESGNEIDCGDFDVLNWTNFGLVSVRTSIIAPGINGLIAMVDFKEGDVITGYEGKIVKSVENDSPDNTSHDSELPGSGYAIRGYKLPKEWLTMNAGDGAPRMTNVGCMANDAMGSKYLFPGIALTHVNNSVRSTIPRDCIKKKFVDIISTKGPSKGNFNPQYIIANGNITRGSEILWSYGKSYWMPKASKEYKE
jgi:hypothetical protein